MVTAVKVPAYAEVSKFPAVIRDLAVGVDQDITCFAVTP